MPYAARLGRPPKREDRVALAPGRLRRAASRAGLGPQAIATHMGVPVYVVQDWMRGRTRPKRAQFNALCVLLSATRELLRA